MRAALSAKAFAVCFRFHGDLSFFLPRENRGTAIVKTLHEKTSVKDAIESCGVPHPEVDLIYCDGVAVPFEHLLTEDAVVDVHGLTDSPVKRGEGLQQRRIAKFVADGHLGKLARVTGSVPHPQGSIDVAIDAASAVISTPVPGELIWRGASRPLIAGVNRF